MIGTATATTLSALGAQYLELGLQAGLHDPMLVDAYTGPAEHRPSSNDPNNYPIPTLVERAGRLRTDIARHSRDRVETIEDQRVVWLAAQARGLETFLEMQNGRSFSIREQAGRFYDIHPPVATPERTLQDAQQRLDALLPGEGALRDRLAAHRQRRSIPAEQAETLLNEYVFPELARRFSRSLGMGLPTIPHRFTLELVSGVTWRAYNWWQGAGRSLIQFNRAVPFDISRLAATAAHETIPGHHMHHVGIEEALVRGRGWMEHTLDLFHTPWCLVAEGLAENGLRLLMSQEEWIDWHRQFFASAGLAYLDPAQEFAINEALTRLELVSTNAALQLDGGANVISVEDYLQEFGLISAEEAARKIAFIQQYGAYIFNYPAGRTLVGASLDAHLARGGNSRDWYHRLISEPVTPGLLRSWIAANPDPA